MKKNINKGSVISLANVLPNHRQTTLASKEEESVFHDKAVGKDRSIWRLENQQDISKLMSQSLFNALRQVDMAVNDIDYVIVAISCPNSVQNVETVQFTQETKLRCPVMAISAGTSGGVAAMELASGLISQGHYRHIAIIAACCYSHYFDINDPTKALLSDGAACMIISSDSGTEIVDFQSVSTCDYLPLQLKNIENKLVANCPKEGGEVFTRNYDKTIKQAVTALCDRSHISVSDINKFHFYDPISWVPNVLSESLAIKKEKIELAYDKYGSLGAAQNLFGFYSIVNQNQLAEGDYIVLSGFAPGMISVSVLLGFKHIPTSLDFYSL